MKDSNNPFNVACYQIFPLSATNNKSCMTKRRWVSIEETKERSTQSKYWAGLSLRDKYR